MNKSLSNFIHSLLPPFASCLCVLTVATLTLAPLHALASDPFDHLDGVYSGSVTIGDSSDGGIIPGEFLLSIDLGLTLQNSDSGWTGQISFKRFVTTNATRISPPDCQSVPSRELTAPLTSISINPDGTFQATSGPIFLCVRNDKAVQRQVQLQGVFVTRNNCHHIELRGLSYGNYQETVTGLITLPSTNQTMLVGTFLLVKAKESPDAGVPVQGDECPDLNP